MWWDGHHSTSTSGFLKVGDKGREGLPHNLLETEADIYETVEIDTRQDIHLMHHVKKILCCDIAFCAGDKRAATQPSQG